MEFRVLGPVEIHDHGHRVDVGGARATSLLAALLAHRGQSISQDRLAEAIWPESTRGRDNLQSYVSRIRRELGPKGDEILSRTGGGYSLHPGDPFDAERFETLLGEGARALADDTASALARTQAALDLWRGPAYGEFAGDELVHVEAIRLEELRLAAREQRIDAQLALGQHRRVIGELETLCELHPLRERLWELRMLALVRSGRQAEALRAYQQARNLLVEELGIEPSGPLRRMEQMVLAQDPALDMPGRLVFERDEVEHTRPERIADKTGTDLHLPTETTPFIGREEDIAELVRMLERARLVTLVGFGGVGKTRLAIQVARAAATSHPAGVTMVELSEVTDPTEVAMRLDEGLSRVGQSEAALLVVDNCEHLIDSAADAITRTLARRSTIRILATSQEPLRVPGETRWRVEPMPVPAEDATAQQVADNDAARLFIDRSRAVRPGLAFDQAALTDIAAICRRLDGIPLAIELAAALTGNMSVTQIWRDLDAQFEVLTEGYRTSPARQQTLAGAFDWSFNLLDPAERRLLQTLRPLPFGFPRRAVEVICADGPEHESAIRSSLGRLVDRSLVSMEEHDGLPVYSILPTIQAFIWERTGWQGGFEQRAFVVTLAVHTEPRLRGTTEQMWSALFAGPADVARRALDLTFDLRDVEAGAFLAGVVAARSTTTGRVGFVGGIRSQHIGRFESGFRAGVDHVRRDLDIASAHVSVPPDFSGFMNLERARHLAAELFERGADIVFHAAGWLGGQGVLEAARNWNAANESQVSVIGVDLDERVTREPSVRSCVLTSMRLQVPVQVYLAVKEAVAAGRYEAAPLFDLANEGVAMSTTGGQIDHLVDELNEIRAGIIAGEIDVPRQKPAAESRWAEP